MIEQASIETLKSQLDVVDVIANYIELKRTGGNYKALCPFHEEATPSFVISPSKQIFHCFGCGAGGDAIKFVMEYEKLSYPEAIEKLAREYNFTLAYTKSSNPNASNDRRVLQQLQSWFYKNLRGQFLDYVKQRGISSASIEKFGIGYAPDSREVMHFLSQNHLPMPACEEVGVIAKNESGGYYARFSKRIMFPIYSANGQVVGFGGRTVANHPAKYINSPQTKLFNKSRTLYGYNLAKQNIYAKKQLIVTEGYIDVIMFHQAGLDTAVASLGTALTRDHLPLLSRGEPKVILAYDGDEAGVQAALKASRLLSSANFEGGVVLFEGGKDPADMIAEGREDEVKKMLSAPVPFFEFIIDTTLAAYDLNNPKQKENAFAEIKSFVNTLSQFAKDSYIPYAANALGVRAAMFKDRKDASVQLRRSMEKNDPNEQSIIKTVLENKALLDMVLDVCDPRMFSTHKEAMAKLCAQEFDDPALRAIEIDQRIQTLHESELTAALISILRRYYERLLQQLPAMQMEFETKTRYLRNIKTKILPKLKKGELISFDALG
ncbi:MAG: DNA primase [Campylobacterota bacterium]